MSLFILLAKYSYSDHMKKDKMGGAFGLSCNAYRVLVWKSEGSRSSHHLPMQAQRGSGGIAPAHSHPGTRRWSALCSNYFTLGKNLGPNV
jgi:hypothetical protein